MPKKSLKLDYAYSTVINLLERGEFRHGERLPNGLELAAHIGVSHLTMRRALARLEAEGHIVQVQGKGIFAQHHRMFREALVLLEYENDHHALFPLPIQRALNDAGYISTLMDIRRAAALPQEFEIVQHQRNNAFIFDLSVHFPVSILESLPEELVKVNIHSRMAQTIPCRCSSILSDSYASGVLGTQELLRHGCRSIALFSGPADVRFQTDRLFEAGVIDTLRGAGLAPFAVYHNDQVPSEELARIIRHCDGCIAILDSQLLQLCHTATELGREIGRDLLAIGRNNTPWAEMYHLTSIDIQPREIGRELKKLLLSADAEANDTHILIPPKLVYRKSCPKPDANTIKKGL